MPTDEMTERDAPKEAEGESRGAMWLVLLVLLAAAIFIGIWVASGDDEEPGSASSTTLGGSESEDADGSAGGPDTVGRILAGDDRLSTFAGALSSAGLLATLDEAGPFTLFAPGNESIEESVLAATIGGSAEDAERILNFHIVDGRFDTDELSAVRSLDTRSGETIRVFPLADGSGVLLNNGVGVSETIESANGIIHIVDGLLIPPGAEPAPSESTSSTERPEDGSSTTTDAATSTTEPETSSTSSTSSSSTTSTSAPVGDGELAELASLAPIQFADSSSTISDASTPTLDRVVEILEANADANIEIGGHTDNVGPTAGNQRLSERRAQAVRDYLVRGGIDADRLTAVGFGPDEPIESNDTAEGRAANRRIEFKVV